MSEFLVASEGGLRRSIIRHFDGGKLQHVRHLSEAMDPHIERVKRLSEINDGTKSEYQYLGSIPRIMINDWLLKQGKNWHDYVTDRDLKAKFLAWFRSDCKKLMAANYQERRSAINRSLSRGRGASILKNYQQEASNESRI